MIENIQQSLRGALEKAFPGVSLERVELSRPPEEKFGDYTSNVALVLAPKLRLKPLDIASSIRDVFSCDMVHAVEVIPPGHLNFFLAPSVLQSRVREVLERGGEFGVSGKFAGKKVLVEFISSNPTGPIHLGNARGGPSGDTLANVLTKAGYVVTREFYVNDFGNQVRILGHSVLGDSEAQYSGEYIADLANKKPDNITDPFAVGQWASKEILDTYIRPTCEKLGIDFDNYSSEQSLHERGLVTKMLQKLREKDLSYESEGATWFYSKRFGDDKDRVLVKSDGKATYTLADFAYHEDKLARGFDRLITYLGADHHSEAGVMKRFVSEILGRPDTLDIVITQMVRILKDGQELKMSKRKGIYYAMDDLLEEVGRDAVRFIFVSYATNSHINFDINLALEQSEKNPVYSVQYAHARLASILRKAREHSLEPSVYHIDSLAHHKELSLLRELDNFPQLIERIAESYETHLLPRYASTLADKLHSFYNACRVIDVENKKQTEARLALCLAVKTVLAETLRLLGVSAPEKM